MVKVAQVVTEVLEPVTTLVSDTVEGLLLCAACSPGRDPQVMALGRSHGNSDPPRLVLRFAIWTGIALALAAAAILLVIRHFDTVQAERGATAGRGVLASTVLRESLLASDFITPVATPRRAGLRQALLNALTAEGVLLAALASEDGTTHTAPITGWSARAWRIPSTSARRAAIVRGEVVTMLGAKEQERKALRTYAPVAVRGGTGVVVVYQDYAPIARAANATFLPVAAIFEGVLILLFIALAPNCFRRVTCGFAEQMDEIGAGLADELTGLPNRTLFKARIVEAIGVSAPTGDAAVVMLLDVDRFKEVNDALGHGTGDLLLQQLGLRLQALLRGARVLARGSAETSRSGILLRKGLSASPQATSGDSRVARKPFDLRGFSRSRSRRASASPRFRQHGDDADTLLPRRRRLMYVANRQPGTARLRPRASHQRRGAACALAASCAARSRTRSSSSTTSPRQAQDRWSRGAASAAQHPTRGLIASVDFIASPSRRI